MPVIIPRTSGATQPPLTDETFRAALALWKQDPHACAALYGHISDWNTSAVTDMSRAFEGWYSFDLPLDGWDTSGVRDMRRMFYGARRFDQPLGSWDVSQVRTMELMFCRCEYNHPLDQWDVGQVENMRGMFCQAEYFNQPLHSWNVGRVRTMQSMFYGALDFNHSLNAWNVSQVSSMASMFYAAHDFNQPLDAWDVGQVSDMSGMFSSAWTFNQPLEAWNVGQVLCMDFMFQHASAFNQPLAAWDVSQVRTMRAMFRWTRDFNQPLDAWNVGQVWDMREMFHGADAFNQPLPSWDVSQVQSMAFMFARTHAFNQPVGRWWRLNSDARPWPNLSCIVWDARAFRRPMERWGGPWAEEARRMATLQDELRVRFAGFLAKGTPDQNTRHRWMMSLGMPTSEGNRRASALQDQAEESDPVVVAAADLRPCPVCVDAAEELRAEPCGHGFCEMCISEVLCRIPDCPLCRQPVDRLRTMAAPVEERRESAAPWLDEWLQG